MEVRHLQALLKRNSNAIVEDECMIAYLYIGCGVPKHGPEVRKLQAKINKMAVLQKVLKDEIRTEEFYAKYQGGVV
jgi:hypothetical protein